MSKKPGHFYKLKKTYTDGNFRVKKGTCLGKIRCMAPYVVSAVLQLSNVNMLKWGYMTDYTQFVLNVEFCKYRVVILPENYHLSLPANTLPYAWADR